MRSALITPSAVNSAIPMMKGASIRVAATATGASTPGKICLNAACGARYQNPPTPSSDRNWSAHSQVTHRLINGLLTCGASRPILFAMKSR